MNAIPDFVLVVDREQRIVYCNRAVQLHLGCEIGTLFMEQHPQAPHGRGNQLDKGSPITVRNRGERHLLNPSPLKDKLGNLVGYVYTGSESAGWKANQQEMHIKDRAIASSINAIAIADPNGVLTYVNPAFLKMWGYNNSEQLINKDVTKVWPDEKMAQMVITTLHTEGYWVDELAVEKKDGTSLNIRVIAELVRGETGEPLCMMASFIDITESKQVEAALRESEDRYRQLFEAESDAIFLIENENGTILEVNEAAKALYGYSRDELLKMSNADLSAEPEQTRTVTSSSQIDDEAVVKIPLRYHRKKDGTIFPVEITGRFFNWRGRPVHIAAIRDITERVEYEEALRESEERYRTIIEQSLQGIIVRQEDRTVLVNRAYANMLGYSLDELVNQEFLEWLQLVHPEDRGMVFQYFRGRLSGKVTPARYVYRLVTRTGEVVWVDAAVNVIQYRGKVAQLSMVLDISEQKRAEEALLDSQRQLHTQLAEIQALQVQLREQAIRDPLTGLFNRRYLEETLLREIAQARRTKTPVGIIMLDLDHFKRFNDTYGHQSGDMVLKELGQLLESRFRVGDISCRYGGEEFVVILPGTELKDVLERAEEIRILFEKQNFYVDESLETKVTISAGVSAYPSHGDNLTAILNRADQALYQAKNLGRNRVIAFDA